VHPILYDEGRGGTRMYKIREFSELTGLSKETLRYYEQQQLLEPATVDPSNNYRYYDDGSYFWPSFYKNFEVLAAPFRK
jgi:hypothetical protein